MSQCETPRTDAAIETVMVKLTALQWIEGKRVSVVFARQLERENVALQSRIAALEAALTHYRNLDWGTKMAWIVEGAPDRASGISASKEIVAANIKADAALAAAGKEGK